MDLRKVKEKATEAFSKGKFAKAAEFYTEYCQGDPKDLQARLRMGDAWAKASQKDKAIAAYKSAAEGYARDGFLPRAIAASKLILELDPAHKDVQVMLADLYARRTSGDGKSKAPARADPRAPPNHRHDAIDLPPDDAPGPLQRADAIELPPETPAPSPMNRKDAIELAPEPPAPSPMNRKDAIELPPDDVPAEKKQPVEIDLDPALADGTVLELDTESASPGAPSARRDSVEIELIPSPIGDAAPAEEIEELELEDVEPAAPNQRVFDLSEELPPELQRVSPDVPPPPPAAPEAEPAAVEEPGEVVLDLEVAPPEPEPEPAPIPLTRAKSPPPPPIDPSPSRPAGPDLRPTGRIWVPPALASQELVANSAADRPTAQPAGWSRPPALLEASSDLQAGLAALAKFDELELEDAGIAFVPSPTPQVPAARPEAPRPPPRMPSFTELELEGDSLLHAVEAAARAGIEQGAAAPEEEGFTLEDAHDSQFPGALPKIPLFSDLAPDAFIELFERCPLRRVTQGERIMEQGSVGDSFFVICAGSVRVYRTDAGVRRDIATLEEGAFFGEVALLSDAPRTASVEAATEDTQLLEISATVLAQLSHRYPQVASALKKFCRQRLLSNLMSSNALFRPFNKKERRELVEKFRARDVQKGDVVLREGERGDGLYIVLSGEVEVRKGDRVLAQLNEGEIFGEMSLLQKTPASATVFATKRTSLLRLPRQDFDAVVLSHPQILVLISELQEDRRRQNEALLGGVAQMGDEGLLLV